MTADLMMISLCVNGNKFTFVRSSKTSIGWKLVDNHASELLSGITKSFMQNNLCLVQKEIENIWPYEDKLSSIDLMRKSICNSQDLSENHTSPQVWK